MSAEQIKTLAADLYSARKDEEFFAAREAHHLAVDALADELDTQARALKLQALLLQKFEKEFSALHAELTAWHGLLRESHVKMVENDLWSNLRARIATALWKGEQHAHL